MNIISANGHPEAFQMVETGRAVAFVMDDILLYSLVAQLASAGRLRDLAPTRSRVEPYGIMMRKDDPAFKKVVDARDDQHLQERRDQRDLRRSGS